MKTGWKTSEFWVTATAVVGTVATALAGSVSGTAAVYAGTISAAAYAISRGLAKLFAAKPPAA